MTSCLSMQIMSGTLRDTYINAKVNIVIQPSGNTLKCSMETTEQRLTIFSKF